METSSLAAGDAAPEGAACGCLHESRAPEATSPPPSPARTTTREARALVRARIAELRREIKDARARRKVAIRDAKERCRAERIATRERVRAERLRVLAELREWGRNERSAARQACAKRIAEARAIKDEIERAREKERAERAHGRELARIAKEERQRHAPVRDGIRRRESDEEVRANLTSDLAPLFDRVKGKIRGTRHASRTEVFLKYAEAHPQEVLAAAGDVAERRARELEEEHRQAVKTKSAYETKKAARIERMRVRADRLSAAAEGAFGAAKAISDRIPMGQPILVGHHSERRHRRDLDRIRRGYAKAHEMEKAADSLRRRAEAAESNRAISSDDPEAVTKLREKLDGIEQSRARMVATNKAVRSKDPRAELAALGFKEALIEKLLTPDPLGNIGIPAYALRNAAAEAGRLRQRIAELEAKASAPPPAPVVAQGARIEEADNRVRIVFDAKPDEGMRARLKSAGFRWSPTSGAWQRHASNAAWYHAEKLVGVGGGSAS